MAAMINAGVACEMMGLLEDAAGFYTKAAELDPDNIEAKERLAGI